MEMTLYLALTVIYVFTQVPGGVSTMDNSHVKGTFKCTGPRNSPPKNQSMYWISDYTLTWSEAVDRCHNVSNNGHLVHIGNEEENNEVKAILYQANIDYEGVWIGIHDSEKEGVWTYEDGSNLTYVNWGNGEPNGAYGYEEDCANMKKYGYYKDYNCEWKLRFCCEYYVVIE